MRPNAPRLLAVSLALGLLAGCSRTTAPVAPPADAAPALTTPALAVKRVEWAFPHRDIGATGDLFTDDFAFVGSGVDSVGNPASIGVDRAWTLAALGSMFNGVPNQKAPAEQITLLMDQNPISFPDTRPGKDPRWHKWVRTSVNFKVRIDSGNTVEVTGNALFFMTRGDSVAIPAELRSRGAKPDSARWWIDRWEDETFSGTGAPSATNPTRNNTLFRILELYAP
jgi:hypothetical protein